MWKVVTSGDLGSKPLTVHLSAAASSPEAGPQAAPAILDFWFVQAGRAKWFVKDAAFDRAIAERFERLRMAVLGSRAAGWRDTPDALLAAVILLDQYSRNVHRGSARAFGGDAVALELAKLALDRGWTHAAAPDHRHFLLLPLMHSEVLADQDRSVAEFEALGKADLIDYAHRHRDQILRFGRFPGRNRALGRVSSAEEMAAIAAGEGF